MEGKTQQTAAVVSAMSVRSARMAWPRRTKTPRRLCRFHLLQEYRRNIGWEGWEEAGKLLSVRNRREGLE